MARVPYPTRDDLSVGDAELFDRLERERGTPLPDIFRALLNTPKMIDPVLGLALALRNDTVIERRFRELAILVVAGLTKCQYELDHHWNAALNAGVARDKIENAAGFETYPTFDPQERAVMRYAREATLRGEVSNAAWDGLRAFMDVRQAMEIVITVAWYNMIARLLVPLQIETEGWFRKL